MSVADQCRALGLNVGDTIEGKEGGDNWWNVTRLTLLWLGEREAVWSETHRTSKCDEWTAPRETAGWNLCARDWKRIPPTGRV